MKSISLKTVTSTSALFLLSINAIFASGCQSTCTKSSAQYPQVEIINDFEPLGESNVRSSFQLSEDVALIGTEETGDIFKTEDAGINWRKVLDGGDRWFIMDVRNYIRAQDGHVYITTTEPAMVCRSKDEGESWEILASARGTRTVGIVQLDDESILVGIRRAFSKKISLMRTPDYYKTVDYVNLSETLPGQNVTCFGYYGGDEVLAGIGYQGSGKIFKSYDKGLSWEMKAEFPEARDLMNFFKVDNTIYVLASGISTLYKSEDNGENWEKAYQFWEKGFLGQCIEFKKDDKSYLLMSATDQREKPYRHLIMISDDKGETWSEWIELMTDMSGGANNLAQINENTIIVGTGNHSAQGHAYTLRIK